MAIDFLAFQVFSGELKQILMGAQLQKLFQPGGFEFVFRFRNPGINYFLYINLEKDNIQFHPVPGKFATSIEPTPFCMQLRKHILNARITDMKVVENDRILILEFSRAGQVKKLVFELTGNTANLIILDDMDKYVGAFTRQDDFRRIITGQPYTLPAPVDRVNPLAVQQEGFFKLLDELATEKISIKDALALTFKGLKKKYNQEILFQAGIHPHMNIDELGMNQKNDLWKNWNLFFEKIRNRQFDPVLYYEKDDEYMEEPPVEWSFWEFETLKGSPLEKVSTVSDALQAYSFRQGIKDQQESQKEDLLSAIRKRYKKVKRRLKNQQNDLESARESLKLKTYADLLLANMHLVQGKTGEIQVMDYYEDPPVQRTITLDPSKTPQENAERFYNKYKKARRGLDIIDRRIRMTREELDFLARAKQDVASADTVEDLEVIKQNLKDEGFYQLSRQGKGGKQQEVSGPRRFELDKGYIALVGRNSKQNDQLVTSIGNKEDIWFHATEIPGSHVVLKIQKPSQTIPDRVVHRSAQLAAYFSQARQATKVPVSYTRLKYVRKIKGNKSGKVFYTHEKSILVKPEVFQEQV
ncbi:MAG: NFACT family protein [Vulcanimicrobiota bacterium]